MAEMANESVRVDYQRMTGDDLAALLNVSAALSSTLDVEAVMQIAITSARDVLGLETGAFYMLEDSTLVLGATAPPLSHDFPDEYRRAPLDDHPHIGRCLREGEPVWVSDTSAEELTDAERGVVESRGLRSILYVPLTSQGQVVGTFILGATHDHAEFGESEITLCRTLAHQISLAVANARLHETLLDVNDEREHAYDQTLAGWAATLEMRDRETKGHADRVEVLTMHLVKVMGVPESEWENVRRGTLLHDIGKMVIPDAILHKPGPLDDHEWEIMRKHPEAARRLLERISYLAPALDIPYCHHERWDGDGYPRGLRGEDIPLPARIFAVVDVYDALTSDRPYRPAWTHDEAVAHIAEGSGTQFDPAVVTAFLEAISAEEPDS